MIAYELVDELDAGALADVRDLLERAARYDEEAGFSTAEPEAPPVRGGTVRHVLVTLPPVGQRGSAELDALPDVSLVAYLRADVADGTAELQCVVRPEFRSHGIATLLAERLDAEPSGWSAIPGAVRRVQVWAHGTHPAADRARARVGAGLGEAVFKMVKLIGGSHRYDGPDLQHHSGPADGTAAEVAGAHHASLAPADRATLSRVTAVLSLDDRPARALYGVDDGDAHSAPACIAPLGVDDRETLLDLLGQVLLEVQDTGARAALLYVNALDETAVRVAREMGFEHEQSDHHYVLDLASP